MNQSLKDLDASKLWVPITITITIVLAVAGATWQVRGWASMVTSRLNELQDTTQRISGHLDTIAELAGQVRENKGKLSMMQDYVAAQETRLQTQAAWIQSTRIALAEQGFKTPTLPAPPPTNQRKD